MNDTLAQSLYHFGMTVEEIAKAEPSVLATVPGFSLEKAEEIKKNAQLLIDSGKLAEMKQKQAEAQRAAKEQSKVSSDAVFERLKAEVKAHQAKEKSEEAAAEAPAATEAAPEKAE
jgi:hypothetical protein